MLFLCASAAACSRGGCRCVVQDQKVAELQVWEESVPHLRAMLEEAMEQKAQLQAEKEDCTRLRQGLALTWVPDAAVHKCLNCEVAFGLRKWKNHCRCVLPPPRLPQAARVAAAVVCDAGRRQLLQVLWPSVLLGLHQPQGRASVRARARPTVFVFLFFRMWPLV